MLPKKVPDNLGGNIRVFFTGQDFQGHFSHLPSPSKTLSPLARKDWVSASEG